MTLDEYIEHYYYKYNTVSISTTDIEKLAKLFKKTPHLFCDEFFSIPHELGIENIDTDFYLNKGISTFSKYHKDKESKLPDEQLEYITRSFGYIYMFCKHKKIKLRDYAFYKKGAYEEFLKHIKNHKVSIYVAFAIPEMYTVLINMDSDVYNLYFGDMKLLDLQHKFNQSQLAKDFCFKSKDKISKRIDIYLENRNKI